MAAHPSDGGIKLGLPAVRPAPPAPTPTKKTLVFPHVDVPRPRFVDAIPMTLRRHPPPPPSPKSDDPRAAGVLLELPKHAIQIDGWDDAEKGPPTSEPAPLRDPMDAWTEARASQRPSERPTRPTLPPLYELASHSNTEVIDLSSSVLADAKQGLERQLASEEEPATQRDERVTSLSRWLASPWAGRGVVVGAAAGVVAVVVAAARLHVAHPSEALRAPRHVDTRLTALASGRPQPVVVAPPKAHACVASAPPRTLASRVQIAPGIKVTVVDDSAFGIAYSPTPYEAQGLRVQGTELRIAERVRVRASAPVRQVGLETVREDDDDVLSVRASSDDAPTVFPDSQGVPFRVQPGGAFIVAVLGLDGATRTRSMWPMPASGTTAVSAPAPARDRGKAVVRPPMPMAYRGPLAPDTVRAAATEEGGAVVAIRRGATLWVGVADANFAPVGPLASIPRRGSLGAPQVAPSTDGGVVAWSERAPGDRESAVMVAAFTPDGLAPVGPLKSLGSGTSPSVVTLPDGDILVAYANAEHRAALVRLSHDLELRGEPVLLSPAEMNVSQPVVAVGANGRGVVAFFDTEKGKTSLAAASVLCDPGL